MKFVNPLEFVVAGAAVWLVAENLRLAQGWFFSALQNKNASNARLIKILLRRSSRLSHTGPGGFTTLHAAVLGGRTDALPALVAAGAPLDAALENTRPRWPWNADWRASYISPYEDDESQSLAGIFRQQRQLANLLSAGDTPLVVAVRCVSSALPVTIGCSHSIVLMQQAG